MLSDQEIRDKLLPDVPEPTKQKMLPDFQHELCECEEGFIGPHGYCDVCDSSLSDHASETIQLWDSFE